MRRITVAVATALVVLTWSVRAEEPIPTRFTRPFHDLTIWIAASEAITADGTVRPDILRSYRRTEMLRRRATREQQRARAATEQQAPDAPRDDADTCDVEYFGSSDFSSGWPVHSVAELREAAATRTVISGVVTASAAGFHAGKPHTVLRIETAPPAAARVVYLFYPSARLRFEGMTVCNHDPGFAPLPAIGTAVTVVAGEPSDSTGTLYVTDGS